MNDDLDSSIVYVNGDPIFLDGCDIRCVGDIFDDYVSDGLDTVMSMLSVMYLMTLTMM